jgi:hypothetical protein
MRPHARKDHLLVREVGDELVVYDRERHHAHRLNRTAALVWRHCDGQRTVAEIARLLQYELNHAVDEKLVWLSLLRLDRAHLLRERVTGPQKLTGQSRRQVVRKLGLVGALSFLLPVVTTLAAPTPALAQSGVTFTCTPDAGNTCCVCQGGGSCLNGLGKVECIVDRGCDWKGNHKCKP